MKSLLQDKFVAACLAFVALFVPGFLVVGYATASSVETVAVAPLPPRQPAPAPSVPVKKAAYCDELEALQKLTASHSGKAVLKTSPAEIKHIVAASERLSKAAPKAHRPYWSAMTGFFKTVAARTANAQKLTALRTKLQPLAKKVGADAKKNCGIVLQS